MARVIFISQFLCQMEFYYCFEFASVVHYIFEIILLRKNGKQNSNNSIFPLDIILGIETEFSVKTTTTTTKKEGSK